MATSTDLRSAIEEVQQSLPEDQAEEQEEVQFGEADWVTRLERRVGALPWWVISASIHAVVFLLIGLLAVAAPPANMDEVVISTEIAKQKEQEYDPNKKRDIFKNTKEVVADTKVDNPVVTHEKVEETDHFETDNNMDKNTARGQEDAISDIPLGGTGTVGSIGVGGGGLAGCFGFRDGGGRKKAVGRFGGSEATESAVEAALRWLARHQEADGSWDPKKWEGTHGNASVGMTGIALLTFLGAGYTSKSPSRFQDNVARAERWLVKYLEDKSQQAGIQCKYGFFYVDLYQQGIATLALAEAYGMTKDERLLKAAQAGVDYILSAQGPYEAWTYASKNGVAGRNDSSVSGWNLMALKSAKIAGLKVEGQGFQGAMRWLEAATDRNSGKCAYAGNIDKVTPGAGSIAMTAAGMLMRQFLGAQRDDEIVTKAADFLGQPANLPGWAVGGGGVNFYYWYYGTLCMFQKGGEHWNKWNTKIKEALLPSQCKGGPLDGTAADKDGSWDPVGAAGIPSGGRVFSTSLGALCLEVYYRYLPLYGK